MPEAKLRKVLFYSNYNRKGRWNHYVPTAFAIDSTSAIGASAELLKEGAISDCEVATALPFVLCYHLRS